MFRIVLLFLVSCLMLIGCSDKSVVTITEQIVVAPTIVLAMGGETKVIIFWKNAGQYDSIFVERRLLPAKGEWGVYEVVDVIDGRLVEYEDLGLSSRVVQARYRLKALFQGVYSEYSNEFIVRVKGMKGRDL